MIRIKISSLVELIFPQNTLKTVDFSLIDSDPLKRNLIFS